MADRTPVTERRPVERGLLALALILVVFGSGVAGSAERRRTKSLAELEEDVQGTPRLAVRAGAFHAYALRCIREGKLEQGRRTLERRVVALLGPERLTVVSSDRLDVCATISDAAGLIDLLAPFQEDPPLEEDAALWLLGHSDRAALLLDTLHPRANVASCLRIIQRLYSHDADHRDETFPLILALAVVWDQTRTPLHPQIGRAILAPERDVAAYYDYFFDLFDSREAKVPFRYLSVDALVFVVDTPVPVEELLWAREAVNRSASSWGKTFFDVRYDRSRLAADRIVWPHGPYTLASIRRRGGVCTDQAYYATLTARANGIPALLFVGSGRQGGHAWFGHLRGRDRWELEAGRYANQNYDTGTAVNPQTNQEMTDHEVEYSCERSLKSGDYRKAKRYVRLGERLLRLEQPDNAHDAGVAAVRLAPLALESWALVEAVLKARNDLDGLLRLLERKASTFRHFPDILAASQRHQAAIWRAKGHPERAERILRQAASRVSRSRDDLASALGMDQVELELREGRHDDARRKLERLLKDQRDEGQKVIPLIEAYLNVTKATDQTRAATRFLRSYLESLHRRFGPHAIEGPVFLYLLLQAYENDDDERNAAKVQKQIDRLQR